MRSDPLLSNQSDALRQLRGALVEHRVVWLSGFPGTGKTQIIDALARMEAPQGTAPGVKEGPGNEAGSLPWKAVHVEEAAGESDATLHALAARFATERGRDALDRAAQEPTARIAALLADPVVLVVDEAHRLLNADGQPGAVLRALLKTLTRAGEAGAGRLVLVGVRELGDDRDTERVARVRLARSSLEDAVRLLGDRLEELGRADELTPAQRRGAANRLGLNPRALGYFARALERAAAEELLGGLPEAWEAVEPTLDEGLAEKFQRDMLDQVLAGLDAGTVAWLRALSVLRERVDAKALEALAPNPTDFRKMRDALTVRYLLDQRLGRYRVEPLARELLRPRLRDDTVAHRAAHAAAARLYARHFTGKQIVGGRERDFVEARYHLAIAGDTPTLGVVAKRYVEHLKGEITFVSPVPLDAAARDERVTLLRALDAADALVPAHAYHLARVLNARAGDGDVAAALDVLRRRCARSPNVDVWRLRLGLEGRVGASARLIASTTRDGISAVGAEGSAPLYVRAAQQLAAAGDHSGAIKLLREGIAKVPMNSVSVLYVSAAQQLAAAEDHGGAIKLLREGIARVPVDKNVNALYVHAAELLSAREDRSGAITLLRDGIARVPGNKELGDLYGRSVELLVAGGEYEPAVTLLLEGIATVSAKNGGEFLAGYGSFLVALLGDGERAVIDAVIAARDDYGFVSALRLVLDAERLGRWPEVPALTKSLLAKNESRAMDPVCFAHAALGWLSQGQPRRALEQIDRVESRVGREKVSIPVRWLEAVAALQCGDTPRAARAWGDDDPPSLASLRRGWASPRRGESGHPSWTLPFLPPGLLGQPDAWISPLDGSGLLHEVEALEAAERTPSAPAAVANDPPPSPPPNPGPPAWVRSDRVFDAAVIDSSFTPGDVTGVHVLGSFDRRVTFHNQQVRALLSVRTMHERGRIPPKARVAVLGGGAAGLTAALAAHRLGAAVTVFEQDSLLFPRQRAAAHRWLHPHIYEWPGRALGDGRAGLPLLDWQAGRAQDVVVALDADFRKAFPPAGIVCGRTASHVERVGRGFLISFKDGLEHPADCVIVALGFGDDGGARPPPFVGDTTPDYWDPSDLLEAQVRDKVVVVGGNGDGGLIDAVRAAWRGFRHHKDVEELLGVEEGLGLAAAMLAVDDEARAAVARDGIAPTDLYQRYDKSLKPTAALLGRVRALPQNAASVRLVARTPGLFRLDTALVNRLLVYLLIKASRVIYVRGNVDADAAHGWVIERAGGARERPPGARLVLRRGPDPDYLKRLFPQASAWLVPDNRRVEALALTQELDADTWRFWAAHAS